MVFICKFAPENVNVKRFSNTFPALYSYSVKDLIESEVF